MRFDHPQFLLLLLALPLLSLWKGRRSAAPAVKFPSLVGLQSLGRVPLLRPGWISGALRMMGLALAIIALARPVEIKPQTQVESSGIDIVVAIDISGSMETNDYRVNGAPVSRLAVVKAVTARFIEARPSDQIGLVAFGGKPFIISPPTLSHGWLLERLERLSISRAKDGTAIGSGLAAAVNRLRNPQAKSKIVVLLTDGVNNAGKVAPQAAAEAAAALGIKVYTIAAGTDGRTSTGPLGLFQNLGLIKQEAEIDEATLQAIAVKTGGRFYRAEDTDSLKAIYNEIDQLEKTTHTTKRWETRDERFAWMLVPALALLALELGFAHTIGRQIP